MKIFQKKAQNIHPKAPIPPATGKRPAYFGKAFRHQMGVASLLGYLDIEKNKKLEICFQFPENIAIFAIEINH